MIPRFRSTQTTGVCPICSAPEPKTLGRPGGYEAVWCRKCGSVSTCGIQAAVYDEEYFESGYLRFESDRTAFVEKLIEPLGEGEGRVLIDSGAGIGLAVQAAREKGWVSLGFEPSLAACRLASKRGVPVIRGVAEALPIASSSAHAALIIDVIAHVEDPAVAIREAARVLVPGGRLLVKTPRRPPWAYRLANLIPLRIARGLLHLPYQRHAITGRGLNAMLTANDFEQIIFIKSREAITLRKKLTGSWKARLSIFIVALFESLYGYPSVVAFARRR